MKKYQKWFLVLVWGMVLIQTIVNLTAKNDQKLLEAFEASDSIPLDGNVIVSGSLGTEKINKDTKKNLLISLAGQLGLTKDYSIETKEAEGIQTITLKKESNGEGVWISITSTDKSNYLTTEVSMEEVNKILTIKEQLQETLKKKGIQADTSLYVHGDFPKVLSRKEKDRVEEKLLLILEADRVLQYKDEYSDTIYAYSSLLSDYYERNGDRINLQILLNYNESGKNTQLYLAVPFYNESY